MGSRLAEPVRSLTAGRWDASPSVISLRASPRAAFPLGERLGRYFSESPHPCGTGPESFRGVLLLRRPASRIEIRDSSARTTRRSMFLFR